tara:strand:+ start:81 stop:857 length:777 start_codon:yes stop_codon:yes gene_type:complete
MKKIIKIIRKLKVYYKILFKEKKPTFIFKFSSYDEAKASNSNVTNYLKDDLEDLKSDKFLRPKEIQFENKYNLIPILATTFEDEVSILEFGGGNNPVFSYIKFINKHKKVYTTIIEKESFVNKFKNEIPEEYKKFVQYLNTIYEVKREKFDIVYFGSSLQYFVNHEELFINIFKFDPKYIAISRTFFSLETEDFYVLQNNIENNIFPYKMISFNKFLSLLDDNDYKLIYNFDQVTDHKHENIDTLVCKDLIFKKTKNR